ncbi:MAG: hypothetical protein GY805_39980 [Chloroflexi bacterium]|nr:hypothetical protein [Chloroflexota bacterium]
MNDAMSGDLLQTKLYVPRLRPFLIPRPHLIKQLNQGLQQGCKFTLVSVPTGFGKTTLANGRFTPGTIRSRYCVTVVCGRMVSTTAV